MITALPASNVHLYLVDPAEESFLTSTAPILWLAQFLFVPVVLLNRAGFPIVMLMAGAGMLNPDDTLITLPVALVVPTPGNMS